MKRVLTLCLTFVMLSVGGLLDGFLLPVPDKWADRDRGCGIMAYGSGVDPGFLIPWNRKEGEVTVIPIPDASASGDHSIVIVPVYSSFPFSITINVEKLPARC